MLKSSRFRLSRPLFVLQNILEHPRSSLLRKYLFKSTVSEPLIVPQNDSKDSSFTALKNILKMYVQGL